jgi:hypothetical protein
MRFQDWPERLNRMVADSHHKPFAWGEHDCCLFAANTVLELTGEDYAKDLRGTYKSKRGAAKVLIEHGGMRGIATAALGKEVPPLMAQRGDIVLVQTEQGDTLAVCMGGYCVAPGLERLEMTPMKQAVTAWRVK